MNFMRRRLYEMIQREAPGGPGGPPPPAVPAVSTPTTPPIQPPPGPGIQAPAGSPPGGAPEVEALRQQLAHANGELDKVRKEAAGYRTQNRGVVADAARSLAKLAGVELPADGPPDINAQVAALVERDKKRDAELRRLKIDNELKDLYPKHGVDPKLTKALLSSEGMLADLDPDAEDFGKTLNDAVKKMATENANLKVTPTSTAPGRSAAAQFRPPANETPQLSREEVAAMKPEEVSAAMKKGQLDEILGRRSKTG